MNIRSLLFPFVLLSLALTACGPALTPLPYTEDFSNPNHGWKTVSDEAIKIGVQDGALHFTIDDLDTIAWSTPQDKRFGDFVLDVDATQVDGPNDNTYGVIVRYQDDRNFYRLDISGDGYFAVFKRKDGAWSKVQDYLETPAVKQGSATKFMPVTLLPEDVRPLAEFILIGIEADRKDMIKELHFDLKLSQPALWVLP